MSNAQDKVSGVYTAQRLLRAIEEGLLAVPEISGSLSDVAQLALAWAAIKPMADIERLHGENGDRWKSSVE